ncbi:MAG: 23S rRNA (guanosine(2251)-2'-O)-methyltransferase RlmB [Deltaproteobacteria bacterium]|nr:23S rRNA (guanosine(2251)-2'-O)-methyltransferase RlmB [Deltaproteobacteria bacterium]
MEILYGIHPVQEALKAGKRVVSEIYLAKEKLSNPLKTIEFLAISLKIPVTKVKAPFLKSLAKTSRHQGVAARVSLYPFSDISEIIDNPKKSEYNNFLLLLDNIQDPHNLGALARTALCAGVEGIIITKDRAAGPSPAACKASAGALEHLPLARVTNMAKFVKELKKKEFWIIGMEGEAGQSVFSIDLSCNIAIIIGGEEKGIRPLVKKECDYLVSIPQTGQINSLNASAAGAVVMYEAFRQRKYS